MLISLNDIFVIESIWLPGFLTLLLFLLFIGSETPINPLIVENNSGVYSTMSSFYSNPQLIIFFFLNLSLYGYSLLFLSYFYFFEVTSYVFSSLQVSNLSFNYGVLVHILVICSYFILWVNMSSTINSVELFMSVVFFLNCLYYYIMVVNLILIFFLLEMQMISFVFMVASSLNLIVDNKESNNNYNYMQAHWYFNILLYQYWISLLSSLLIFYGILTIFNATSFLSWFEVSVVIYMEGGVLVLLPFTIGLILNLGMLPFLLWKPEIYKNLNILPLYFYIIPYTFCFFFFIIVFLVSFLWLLDGFYSMVAVVGVGVFLILSVLIYSLSELRPFIAYTSLLHFILILLAISLQQLNSIDIAIFYLLSYFILLFLIILILSIVDNSGVWYFTDLQLMSSYNFLSFTIIVVLFSFAGLPPFLGFFGKIAILGGYLQAGEYWVFFFLTLASLFISFFYLYNYSFFNYNGSYLDYTYILPIGSLNSIVMYILYALTYLNLFGCLILGELFMLGSYLFNL